MMQHLVVRVVFASLAEVLLIAFEAHMTHVSSSSYDTCILLLIAFEAHTFFNRPGPRSHPAHGDCNNLFLSRL
jgi:hypothetical protein